MLAGRNANSAPSRNHTEVNSPPSRTVLPRHVCLKANGRTEKKRIVNERFNIYQEGFMVFASGNKKAPWKTPGSIAYNQTRTRQSGNKCLQDIEYVRQFVTNAVASFITTERGNAQNYRPPACRQQMARVRYHAPGIQQLHTRMRPSTRCRNVQTARFANARSVPLLASFRRSIG
jgi:hypothetical protein